MERDRPSGIPCLRDPGLQAVVRKSAAALNKGFSYQNIARLTRICAAPPRRRSLQKANAGAFVKTRFQAVAELNRYLL